MEFKKGMTRQNTKPRRHIYLPLVYKCMTSQHLLFFEGALVSLCLMCWVGKKTKTAAFYTTLQWIHRIIKYMSMNEPFSPSSLNTSLKHKSMCRESQTFSTNGTTSAWEFGRLYQVYNHLTSGYGWLKVLCVTFMVTYWQKWNIPIYLNLLYLHIEWVLKLPCLLQ